MIVHYINMQFTLESGCNIDINVDAFFDEGDEYNGNKFLTISPTSCKLKTGVDDIEKYLCMGINLTPIDPAAFLRFLVGWILILMMMIFQNLNQLLNTLLEFH